MKEKGGDIEAAVFVTCSSVCLRVRVKSPVRNPLVTLWQTEARGRGWVRLRTYCVHVSRPNVASYEMRVKCRERSAQLVP